MFGEPIVNDVLRPLVSIAIINYNYGKFLRHCFDSVFSQTYENYEVIFSDNASDDDSWDIALEYSARYPGRITLFRNRRNFGTDANFANCQLNFRGKYYIELCSDDALAPEYLEKCVYALENNPTAAFAMVHRSIIDENGNMSEEMPFYNKTCIIPGVEQASVYMVAAVNPSISQVMYNKRKAYGKDAVGGLAARWYGPRFKDFNICCEYPVVYIKDPLLLHRVHSKNDSLAAAKDLIEIVGPYILHYQFAETASFFDLKKVNGRLTESMANLGKLCLRYCVRFLLENDERSAKRYYHLAQAILPEITESQLFGRLKEYFESDSSERLKLIDLRQLSETPVNRIVSYDPPEGSIPIEVEPKAANGKNILNQEHS